MGISLIETQAEALSMVEADLITIQDYVLICKTNGWDATLGVEAAKKHSHLRLVRGNSAEIQNENSNI